MNPTSSAFPETTNDFQRTCDDATRAHRTPPSRRRRTVMRTFDDQHVLECLDYRTLIEALRAAFATGSVRTALTSLETGTGQDSKVLMTKTAWDEDVTVVKVLTLNERNRQSAIPFIQGSILIFDKATGTPFGVVDAKEITCRRTAAASALAADYLAVAHAEVLTLIGTGALAPHMALAHAVTRPIRQINVFGRNVDKAEATAATIGRSVPTISVRAVTGSSRSCSRAHMSFAQRHPASLRSFVAPGFPTVHTSILSEVLRPTPGRPTTAPSPRRASTWTSGMRQ